jgi:hypothetical protein
MNYFCARDLLIITLSDNKLSKFYKHLILQLTKLYSQCGALVRCAWSAPNLNWIVTLLTQIDVTLYRSQRYKRLYSPGAVRSEGFYMSILNRTKHSLVYYTQLLSSPTIKQYFVYLLMALNQFI